MIERNKISKSLLRNRLSCWSVIPYNRRGLLKRLVLLTLVVAECQNKQLCFITSYEASQILYRFWNIKKIILALLAPYLKGWSLNVDFVVWFLSLSTTFVLKRFTKSYFCFKMISLRDSFKRFVKRILKINNQLCFNDA